MAFHNTSLPGELQYQSIGGPGFNTLIQETSSGHEYRIGGQAQARHRFTLRKELQSQEEAALLKHHAMGQRGSLHSWRLKDWGDFTTATNGIDAPDAEDVTIGSGDGTETTFALQKLYDAGGDDPYARGLSLPVDGTVVVAVDGVTTTSFTVSGDGDVVFASAPLLGTAITAGCEFDVPVRFTKDFDTWAQMQIDAYQTWNLPDMGCIEVLDEVERPERWNPGGATDWGTTSQDIVVAMNNGKLQLIDADASISAFLPATDRIPGGHIFTFHVPSGAAGDVTVRDIANNALVTVNAGDTVDIGLIVAGTTYWVAY